APVYARAAEEKALRQRLVEEALAGGQQDASPLSLARLSVLARNPALAKDAQQERGISYFDAYASLGYGR
ncbi:MAG: hypothetical protein FWG66_09090, partial [Spirochaetes bacterium]|nr:hypothetical protein [Spirochaetota bacterium]